MRVLLLLTLLTLAGVANAWAGTCPSDALGDPRLVGQSAQTAGESESPGDQTETDEADAEDEEEEEEPDCE